MLKNASRKKSCIIRNASFCFESFGLADQILQKKVFLLMFSFFTGLYTNAQATISSDDFENTLTVFSQTSGTGSFYSGNSAATDRPATSPFAASNSYGYGVSNGTVSITSSNINT